jgi:hypothetical protein
VPTLETDELSERDSRAIAAVIRVELARRRISRQRLADDAKISLSTLEKALGGSRPFTLSTLVRLEAALGIKLRAELSTQNDQVTAPSELGGYSRGAVAWLEGDYLTLRPSLEVARTIYAYRTEIRWEADRLRFREQDRLDAPFAQSGDISIPNKSGHIYLYTNNAGQMRLAILGRPLIGGEMYGVLATLQSGRGTQLLPVSLPLALIPAALPMELGRIAEGEPNYELYQSHLDRILSENFARLVAN